MIFLDVFPHPKSQLMKIHLTRQLVPLPLVELLTPVVQQHQAPLALRIRHRYHLLRVLLADHRKEQVEDIVVQHAVIVPPVGI